MVRKHSPGPWVIEEGMIVSRHPSGDGPVGTVYGVEEFPCLGHIDDEAEFDAVNEELIGNGLLITAAPDMYVVLEMEEHFARKGYVQKAIKEAGEPFWTAYLKDGVSGVSRLLRTMRVEALLKARGETTT